VREESPSYDYHDEDQSRSGRIEVGMRVRHATFGAGTVLSIEAADGDTKLVVRFASAGTKRLLGRYANLQPV
jgi:DNA helicase-2/ATP-dependent DNA helicase PcrA